MRVGILEISLWGLITWLLNKLGLSLVGSGWSRNMHKETGGYVRAIVPAPLLQPMLIN